MRGLPFVAVAVGLLSACNGQSDVVASAQPLNDDPLIDAPLLNGCMPGNYVGAFSGSIPPVLGEEQPFRGFISFSLVGSNSGEFLEVDTSSELKGSSGPYPFTALLTSQEPCTEGEFRAQMEDGVFVIDKATNKVVPFGGPVVGTYDAELKAFSGTWKVFFQPMDPVSPVLLSSGSWAAALTSVRSH